MSEVAADCLQSLSNKTGTGPLTARCCCLQTLSSLLLIYAALGPSVSISSSIGTDSYSNRGARAACHHGNCCMDWVLPRSTRGTTGTGGKRGAEQSRGAGTRQAAGQGRSRGKRGRSRRSGTAAGAEQSTEPIHPPAGQGWGQLVWAEPARTSVPSPHPALPAEAQVTCPQVCCNQPQQRPSEHNLASAAGQLLVRAGPLLGRAGIQPNGDRENLISSSSAASTGLPRGAQRRKGTSTREQTTPADIWRLH